MTKDKIRIVTKNVMIVLFIIICILSVYIFKKLNTNGSFQKVEIADLPLAESNLEIENYEQNSVNDVILEEESIAYQEELNKIDNVIENNLNSNRTSNTTSSNSSTSSSGVQSSNNNNSNNIQNTAKENTVVNNTSSATTENKTTVNTAVEIPVVSEPVKEKYTLYDFGYDGCYYCTVMDPIFNKYKSSYSNIIFKKVDIYESPSLASKYSIQYTPTFIIVDSTGKVVDKTVGACSEDYFRNFVEKYK